MINEEIVIMFLNFCINKDKRLMKYFKKRKIINK